MAGDSDTSFGLPSHSADDPIRATRDAPLGNPFGIEPPAEDAAQGDGRTLRRTRNRQRVIVALLDLVHTGELDPSVADIADRAGVSHRSVFRYFEDINDLVRTAINHEVEKCLPLADIEDIGQGPLERRIDAWVDSRLRLYSATFEVWRVAHHRAPTIPSVDEAMRMIAHMGRGRMRTNFAPEIDALGSTGDLVLDAGLMLTSFESYETQRRMFDHGTERIRQVWHLGLRSLFADAVVTS